MEDTTVPEGTVDVGELTGSFMVVVAVVVVAEVAAVGVGVRLAPPVDPDGAGLAAAGAVAGAEPTDPEPTGPPGAL